MLTLEATNFWGTLQNGHLTYDLPISGAVTVSGEMDWRNGENGEVIITHLAFDEDDAEYLVEYIWV